jgi:hypothetical protein
MQVAVANYASGAGNGMSCAFDHAGNVLVQGPQGTEELVVSNINLESLRAARKSERGRLLLAQPPAPEICEIARAQAFSRDNVFGRNGATII